MSARIAFMAPAMSRVAFGLQVDGGCQRALRRSVMSSDLPMLVISMM